MRTLAFFNNKGGVGLPIQARERHDNARTVSERSWALTANTPCTSALFLYIGERTRNSCSPPTRARSPDPMSGEDLIDGSGGIRGSNRWPNRAIRRQTAMDDLRASHLRATGT
jgi:hypothetical protein